LNALKVRWSVLLKKKSTIEIEVPSGVLLYGPPGVGKTYLVASIAKVCGAEMVRDFWL
jgi:ATP-dependent 26S proteasome regulatory subunit